MGTRQNQDEDNGKDNGKDSLKWADFPDTESILDRKKRVKCQELFEELEALEISILTYTERVDEIKHELDAFQYMVDAPGIRHGDLIYSLQQLAGRRSLNRNKLMENGVEKDVIDASYTVGKPYERRTFKRLASRKDMEDGLDGYEAGLDGSEAEDPA